MGAKLTFEFKVTNFSSIDPNAQPEVRILVDVNRNDRVNDENELPLHQLSGEWKWIGELDLADDNTKDMLFVAVYKLSIGATYDFKVSKEGEKDDVYHSSHTIEKNPVGFVIGRIKK